MKKGGYRIAAPSQKKHQRPSYGLACSRPSHSCRKSPASRSLATALSEGALARGLLHMSRTLTIPQLNATNYPPARHRTPGDIMSEYRATSSRNAWATSSESAAKSEPHRLENLLQLKLHSQRQLGVGASWLDIGRSWQEAEPAS